MCLGKMGLYCNSILKEHQYYECCERYMVATIRAASIGLLINETTSILVQTDYEYYSSKVRGYDSLRSYILKYNIIVTATFFVCVPVWAELLEPMRALFAYTWYFVPLLQIQDLTVI